MRLPPSLSVHIRVVPVRRRQESCLAIAPHAVGGTYKLPSESRRRQVVPVPAKAEDRPPHHRAACRWVANGAWAAWITAADMRGIAVERHCAWPPPGAPAPTCLLGPVAVFPLRSCYMGPVMTMAEEPLRHQVECRCGRLRQPAR